MVRFFILMTVDDAGGGASDFFDDVINGRPLKKMSFHLVCEEIVVCVFLLAYFEAC